MSDRVEINGLQVAQSLYDFAMAEALPGTGVDADTFWLKLSEIIHDLSPKNRQLLEIRDDLQAKIDAWHKEHGAPSDLDAYQAFLREIGYLREEGPAFQVNTSDVDAEIADIAGPQLVVPVMNARYALNAANARWGSIYDALYGTDAISEADGAEKGKGYNPKRGAKVIAWARQFLDQSAPLQTGSWSDATGFSIEGGKLVVRTAGGSTALKDAGQFVGYSGDVTAPNEIFLKRNNLHVRIAIDADHPIGGDDKAH